MKGWKTTQGTVLVVYVKPNSNQFQIKTEKDKLVVFCRETPKKGRVNRELIKKFSKIFQRKVEILSGFTSRQKRILIRDASIQEVNEIISEYEIKYTQ